MTDRTPHATTLAACSALTLTLTVAIALAQTPESAQAPQPSTMVAPPPVSGPTAPPVAPPVPQPAAFIPPPQVLQHRERGNLIFDGIPPPNPEVATRLARYQQSRG